MRFLPAPSGKPKATALCTKRGFTLIELLVVVAVIGILTAIAFPVFSGVRNQARVTQTRAQFNRYITAMEAFRSEYGYYPTFTLPGTAINGDHHLAINATIVSREAFSTSLTGRELNGNRPRELLRPLNPKEITFLSFSESEVEDNRIVDAFGNNDIRVIIDKNYNDRLSVSAFEDIDPGEEDIRASVVFYSVANDSLGLPTVTSW